MGRNQPVAAVHSLLLKERIVQRAAVERTSQPHTVLRAHDLAAGVGSVRPAARIASVARKLARHRRVPEVSAALDRIHV